MPLLPRLSLPITAAIALAVPAVPALAAPVTVTVHDGDDSGARGPGTDMQEVRTTFDADAGTWSVTVRFYGPMAADDWAMVNATIFTPSSDPTDCTLDNTNFGWFRTSSKPGSTTLRGAVGAPTDRNPDGTLGETPWEHLTRTESADGRELTIDAASPRLIGREPGCVTVNMSYNGVIDSLSPGAVFATKAPAGSGDGTGTGGGDGDGPTGAPGGGTDGGGTPVTPVVISLAPATTTLHRSKLRVRLAPFPVAATGAARLTAGGTTLARATWHAEAKHAVSLRLHRTAPGRRWMHRHPRGQVRLRVTARPVGPSTTSAVAQIFRMRLRR